MNAINTTSSLINKKKNIIPSGQLWAHFKMNSGDLSGTALTNYGSQSGSGTLSRTNNISLSTTQFKTGTTSLYVSSASTGSDYVTLPTLTLYPTVALGLTFSFWAFINSSDSLGTGLYCRIFELTTNNTQSAYLAIRGTKLAYYFPNSGWVTTTFTATNSTWTHYTVVVNGGFKIYINGTLTNSAVYTASGTFSGNLIYLFSDPAFVGEYTKNSYIDDFRTYSGELTTTQITDIINGTI